MNTLCTITALLPSKKKRTGTLSLCPDCCVFSLKGINERLHWSCVTELTLTISPVKKHRPLFAQRQVLITLCAHECCITALVNASDADKLGHCIDTLKDIHAEHRRLTTILNQRIDSLANELASARQQFAPICERRMNEALTDAQHCFDLKLFHAEQQLRAEYAAQLSRIEEQLHARYAARLSRIEDQHVAEKEQLQSFINRLTAENEHLKKQIIHLSTPPAPSPAEPAIPPQPTFLPSTAEGFALSSEQARAFDILEAENRNIFITGEAGTGKSVLLRHFASHTHKRIALLAPTGLAALNIGGETLHRFFGLPATTQINLNPAEIRINEEKRRIIKALDALVIDEISMVRSDVMDAIDKYLRVGRGKLDQPFGGCQIIIFGDLYQLPPVPEKDTDANNYIYDTYGTLFFFGAPAVHEAPFRVISLRQIHRQQDDTFIRILNNIRINNTSFSELETLNQRCLNADALDAGIILTPHTKTARRINAQNLKSIVGKEYVYRAAVSGDFIGADGRISPGDAPAEVELRLKTGARVMLIRNDSSGHWVNGTFAEVGTISNDCIHVIINGIQYPVPTCTCEKYKYTYNVETKNIDRVICGRFTQYPVRLAYAITIHKSQGQSYDHVTIDYSNNERAFASGQTYVALSRCRSLAGLRLKVPLLARDIQTNNEVVDWFERISIETL